MERRQVHQQSLVITQANLLNSRVCRSRYSFRLLRMDVFIADMARENKCWITSRRKQVMMTGDCWSRSLPRRIHFTRSSLPISQIGLCYHFWLHLKASKLVGIYSKHNTQRVKWRQLRARWRRQTVSFYLETTVSRICPDLGSAWHPTLFEHPTLPPILILIPSLPLILCFGKVCCFFVFFLLILGPIILGL